MIAQEHKRLQLQMQVYMCIWMHMHSGVTPFGKTCKVPVNTRNSYGRDASMRPDLLA